MKLRSQLYVYYFYSNVITVKSTVDWSMLQAQGLL